MDEDNEYKNEPQISKPNAFFLKKMSLGFLIITVVGVSLNNGILALNATYLTYISGFPCYEWLNYLFLSLFLLICPILSLFFLDSVHIRRLLRLFLFGMAITKVSEVFGGTLTTWSNLFNYDRPFNAIYILVESSALLICWLILLRQVRGKSLLPIAVNTDRRGILSAFKNLKKFITMPKSSNRKRVNIIVLINVLFITGVFITMLPENMEITLEWDDDNEMRISFWVSGAQDYDNETLQFLSENNITLYGWMGLDSIDTYSKFKISNFQQKSMPRGEDPEKIIEFYHQVDLILNWSDSQNHTKEYFKFIFTILVFSWRSNWYRRVQYP